MKPVRPADVTVVLAAAQAQQKGWMGWANASQVAFYLELLGFEVSSQQAAAYLRRLARLDCPPVASRPDAFLPWREYRVTGFGKTWVHNVLGLRLEGRFPHPSEIGETR